MVHQEVMPAPTIVFEVDLVVYTYRMKNLGLAPGKRHCLYYLELTQKTTELEHGLAYVLVTNVGSLCAIHLLYQALAL